MKAQILNKASFAAFGDVIGSDLRAGASANQGTAMRFDWLAHFESIRPEAKPNLAVFRSVAKTLPFSVRLLERHPCSTQMFVAMKAQRYLVIVAPDGEGGGPDVAQLQAFICGPAQGINYKRGLWHHPIVALDADAEFLMLAWEDGSARDCEEHPFSQPVEVTL